MTVLNDINVTLGPTPTLTLTLTQNMTISEKQVQIYKTIIISNNTYCQHVVFFV